MQYLLTESEYVELKRASALSVPAEELQKPVGVHSGRGFKSRVLRRLPGEERLSA